MTKKNLSSEPEAVVGTNIRKYRKQCGISQERLAELSDLHRTYIGSVERGERNISVRNIFVIAQALDVDPRQLLQPPE